MVVNWGVWGQIGYIFGSLLLLAAMYGVRDAWRKNEETTRIKNPDLADKWSTKWHLMAAILWGTASILFGFSIFGFQLVVLCVLAISLSARWMGVDPAWALARGKVWSYVGNSSKSDKMLGKGVWKMIIVKVLTLAISILVSYFIITKI